MTKLVCTTAIVVALIGLGVPAAALAQTSSVTGALGVTVSSDDNIQAAPSNAISDTVYGVTGSVAWDTKSDKGSFGLSADFNAAQYDQHTEENAFDYGVGANGAVDFTGGKLFAGAGYSHDTEDRKARIARRDTRKRTEYTTSSGDVGVNFDTAGISWTARLDVAQLNYDDARLRTTNAVVDQDNRDRTDFTQSLTATFPSTGGVSLFASVHHFNTNYDLSPPASVHNRDSESWTVTGGAGLKIASGLTGSVEAGVTTRAFEEAAFKDNSTLYVDANVKWAVSPTTTVRAYATRDIQETQVVNSSSYVQTIVGASVNQSFGERYGLRLSLSHEWDDHKGIDRSDDVTIWGVGFTAQVTPAVQADITYVSQTEDSSGVLKSLGFDDGQVSAGLSMTF